jgi:signal transduction histidine kinase
LIESAIPANEAERLAALRGLEILDTAQEERFDRLTRLASVALEVPIAVISLVDANRQWFKSCLGLDAEGTPRSVSFCSHAILADDTFVIADATADVRFADNPLVTGEPFIRAYAGQPLITAEGFRVGSLCVIDQRARDFPPAQLGMLRDLAAIAADQIANLELTRARRAAEEADQAKGDFLATISHELRTPLNAIIGYSELLAEDAEDLGATSMVEDLGKIKRAGQHLLALIGQVLDLAKVEAGKLEPQFAEVDALALAREAVETLGALAGKTCNKLALKADEDAGVLVADPTLVRQVLFNLIGNACKFTQDGCVTLEVRGVGDHIVFAVHDTGPGISSEQLVRLFSSYVQADRGLHLAGGTGLGLMLARRFARLMGGDVQATSVLGTGSTFTLTLPRLARVPDEVRAT